jgi:hypothetical protein
MTTHDLPVPLVPPEGDLRSSPMPFSLLVRLAMQELGLNHADATALAARVLREKEMVRGAGGIQ